MMLFRKVLAIGIVILFLVSSAGTMIPAERQEACNRSLYDCYHRLDTIPSSSLVYVEYKTYSSRSEKEASQMSDGGLMNSSWPMYCHDARHTSRSPYSTINTCHEIWNLETDGPAEGGPTIDENGVIYIGSYYLNAIYPNGTLKWKYLAGHSIVCSPAIDENGIIYFGMIYSDSDYLYALYSNNGTLKWKYWAGNDIFSSPAIGDDGTIYFGSGGGYPPTGSIHAVYPNGTIKWKYNTNHVVYSSPAIGQDGTIFCGCHDTYLYALYQNNGTLKWKYKTGDWIRTSPCIGDDGTIYVVSLDGYLYAVNPNSSLKWKTNVGAGTSPTVGQDGTIYCGWNHLYAINPINGSVKWTFDVGGTIEGGTPCNSIDGTIYVGTSDGGELIAINSDGAEKWREKLEGYVNSPPAIGVDGTVYIGSDGEPGIGYLHAFGIGALKGDANGSHYGLINQPVQFTGSATGGYQPYSWHWNFGDEQTSTMQNPIHTYTQGGNYTVTLTVTDNTSNTSSDITWAKIKESNNPPDKPSINGQIRGKAGTPYDYIFIATDPDNDEYVYYYIDWGDNSTSGWIGKYTPGIVVTVSHTWSERGTYIIKAKAKDNYGGEGDWGTLQVTMPKNKELFIMHPLLNWLLERFSNAFPILRYLLGFNY
jgi:outer membrane protein assembly factor BamB